MKRTACLMALLLVLAAPHFAAAQIPQCLSYQGTLRNASGALVTGNHDLTLRIYTAQTGGTAIWTETISNVAFSRGVFTALLGDPSRTPPAPLNLAFDRPYWLGISIDGGAELTPRVALCASPYSFNAKAVRGNTSTSNLFPADGNAGIGTLTPAGKLHIEDTNWPSAALLVKGLSGAVVGPAITMDATNGTSGRSYSIISTNSGAAAGGSKLAIFDNTLLTGGYRFVLDAAGNIGMGTTAPTTKLHVNGRIAAGVSGSTAGAMTFFPSDGFAWFHIDNGPTGGRPTGRLRISTGGNPGDVEMMSILQNGNVGIGTSSPASKLHVVGRTTTQVLEITGGSDLSEQFEVNHAETATALLQPGMVVSIDAQNPGKLVVCSKAYDHKVAGIISGANGIATGMLMGQYGSEANGSTPVALAGRVYCRVDASFGAIEPGDLLTTSDTPGHAMKVADHAKSQGAIIGKAMTGLAEGKGLVLVLVTLQ